MSVEIWKVEVAGNVYDTDLETLKQWIIEGRVQPTSRVQKGTLPWNVARNVPALREVCAQSPLPPQMPLMPNGATYPMPIMSEQMAQGQMPNGQFQSYQQQQYQPTSYQPVSHQKVGTGQQYYVMAPGFEGRQFYVEMGGLFSSPKLMIDGQPAARAQKRGHFLLRRNDGVEVVARMRNVFVDPIPKVIIEGQTIQIAESLKWYEWLWICAPLFLMIVGGAIGGAIGGLTVAVNGRIFRSDMGDTVKYLVTGAITAGAVIGYFMLAIVLAILIQGS
jgi:hypothetical protein